MDINLMLLAVALTNLSCCIWTLYFNDENSVYIDSLTGCYNRHFMKEIENKEMSGEKFYTVFCDIDFFKKVNDTYGHEAGDKVLVDFVTSIKSLVKSRNDYVLRWGGEEFVLFLSVSDTEVFSTKKLEERIEELRVFIENNKIEYNGEIIKITASFGICSCLEVNINERVSMADLALYKAKSTGRNKVILNKKGEI